MLVFSSVVGNEFVRGEDEHLLANTQAFRGLGADNLRFMLTDGHTFGHFAPVTWLSFAADHFLSGVSARGVHLHNLVLHVICALLVYVLAGRLLSHAVPGRPGRPGRGWAAVAAMLFALHPLRVEPVAWVMARGYLLAGLFAVAALIAYVRYAECRIDGRPGYGSLLLCCLFYVLSLLAVPVAIGLPFVMLVLDVYPLRRRSRGPAVSDARPGGLWFEKVPLLAVASLAAILAPLAKASQGSLVTTYSVGSGLALAAYGLAFGIVKTVLPIGLSPLYQLYPDFSPTDSAYIGTALSVTALTVLLVLIRKRFPAGLAAWICYVVLMLPVSGLVHYGLQVTADRYTYVASIGLALLAAGIGARWQERRPSRAPAAAIVAALVVVLLASGTWRYTAVWQNSTRLWERVVDLDPRSYTALNHLGIALEEQGKHAEALAMYRRAAEVNSAYPPLRDSLGHVAAGQGRLDDAIGHLEASLSFKPNAKSRILLATVLARAGRVPEAMEQARLLAGSEASSSELHALITGNLIEQGHDAAAIAVSRAGLAETPDDPVQLNNLAWLLATSYDPACRNGPEALAAAEKMMLRMEGKRPPPQFFATLGAANAEQGRFDQAVKATENAIKLARQERDAARVDEYAGYLLEYRALKPHREAPPKPSPWTLAAASGSRPN